MRIDYLELTNFKNFGHLSVDFQPGVNLLVGGNGSGKTSLLEGINVAVGGFFASQEYKMQRVIKLEEAKVTKDNSEPFYKWEPFTTVSANSELIPDRWSRTFNSKTKANNEKNIKPAKEYGERIFKAFDLSGDKTVAPLIGYYSTQRLFIDAALSGKRKYDALEGRRNGYLQCLEDKAIKTVLNEWLGNAVTRRATKQINKINGVDNILENVEQAIKDTVKDFLNVSEVKIFQDPDFKFDVFLQLGEDTPLPLSYYSDGFRNLLYLVIDLVWRASQLNPWMDLEQISAQVTGVVTIDEIDLHLHPKWQAKAIGLLQGLFPNVQFFITTHSPTVVANFEKGTKGALFVIDDNEVRRSADKFFGKQIDTVLREVLGAPDRHVPTQIKIDRLFRTIDNEGPEEEINTLLLELTELLGRDDVEIQRAISLIEWNKIKNEDTDAIHQ